MNTAASWAGASSYLWITFGSLVFILFTSFFGDHDASSIHDMIHDGGDSDNNNDGPSVLSMRNISVFFLGFGAAGALSMFNTGSQLIAIGAGLLVGVVMAALAFFVTRFFYRQQTTTESSASSAVGKVAHVVMEIAPDANGQISVPDQYGTPAVFTAISSDGKIHKEGSAVKVKAFSGINALVAEYQG